jgi:anti-sigma B factor antagonist
MTALRSRIESEGERKIIRLAGELDLAVADDVLALGLLALDADNVVELVLDMDDVTFLDSTGIGTLIRIRNAAIARGVELQLRGVGPRIRRVLSITGLENVFDCLP